MLRRKVLVVFIHLIGLFSASASFAQPEAAISVNVKIDLLSRREGAPLFINRTFMDAPRGEIVLSDIELSNRNRDIRKALQGYLTLNLNKVDEQSKQLVRQQIVVFIKKEERVSGQDLFTVFIRQEERVIATFGAPSLQALKMLELHELVGQSIRGESGVTFQPVIRLAFN